MVHVPAQVLNAGQRVAYADENAVQVVTVLNAASADVIASQGTDRALVYSVKAASTSAASAAQLESSVMKLAALTAASAAMHVAVMVAAAAVATAAAAAAAASPTYEATVSVNARPDAEGCG